MSTNMQKDIANSIKEIEEMRAKVLKIAEIKIKMKLATSMARGLEPDEMDQEMDEEFLDEIRSMIRVLDESRMESEFLEIKMRMADDIAEVAKEMSKIKPEELIDEMEEILKSL